MIAASQWSEFVRLSRSWDRIKSRCGWHVGPDHTISKSHLALQAWAGEQAVEIDNTPWEVYWTDPGMEPDPNKWRTQLFLPVTPQKR